MGIDHQNFAEGYRVKKNQFFSPPFLTSLFRTAQVCDVRPPI
jgi:hypothetical protein